MMVLTFRLRKKAVAAALCGLAALTAAAAALSLPAAQAAGAFGRGSPEAPAATNEERVLFIQSRGIEVEAAPISQMEVRIPPEFDAIYVGYNQIQQAQGFNLEKYRGQQVTKYSYAVKAPQGQEPDAVASLLVYQGRIVGADLCSRELGGFLKALDQAQPQ